MDGSGEVEAYASAAAQAHLDTIDNTLSSTRYTWCAVASRGRALDIGTGPGQIVIKLARKLPRWNFVGVDRSPGMIAQARTNLAAAGDAVSAPRPISRSPTATACHSQIAASI